MSNITDTRILEEGPRNAIVVISGTLDAADVSLVPAVSLRDFVNNDTGVGALVGLRVDRVDYSIGNKLEVLLAWQSDSPRLITPVAGRGHLNFCYAGGKIPVMTDSGYTGGINLTTVGFNIENSGQPQYFTVQMEIVKLYAGNPPGG
jgi:hypothetical protein